MGYILPCSEKIIDARNTQVSRLNTVSSSLAKQETKSRSSRFRYLSYHALPEGPGIAGIAGQYRITLELGSGFHNGG